MPPGPDRPELHYSQVAFDSGLRTQREARVADVDALPRGAQKEARIWDLPSQRLFTAQRKGRDWTAAATAKNLEKVSEKYRKVLKMFYWEGRTALEIAEEMGIVPRYEPGPDAKQTSAWRPGMVWNNNVWVLLHRARKELLDVLRREQEEK